MRTLALLGIAAGIVCGASTLTTPAGAATTYLSRSGTTAPGSTCQLSAPCASMALAVGAAGSGGEVICLDKGSYGGLVITFSITISCGGGLFEAPGSGFSIDTPAGNDVVIEGLVSNTSLASFSVINFIGQGTLHLRGVRIGNNSTTTGAAISFQPSGPAKLFVSDSDVFNIGSGGTASAILLRPSAGATANVTIERTRIQNNRYGIIADGTGGGVIRGLVSDSVIAGNVNNGITVGTTGPSVVLTIESTKISGNGFGLVATGANAGMVVRRSVITNNTTGLATDTGAVLLSTGDNNVNVNGAGETFSKLIGLK